MNLSLASGSVPGSPSRYPETSEAPRAELIKADADSLSAQKAAECGPARGPGKALLRTGCRPGCPAGVRVDGSRLASQHRASRSLRDEVLARATPSYSPRPRLPK